MGDDVEEVRLLKDKPIDESALAGRLAPHILRAALEGEISPQLLAEKKITPVQATMIFIRGGIRALYEALTPPNHP